MRSTETALRREKRRSSASPLLSVLLPLPIVGVMLFLLTGLFPTPDGLLADLGQRPELQGASPARVLLEGMAFWYRSLLIFLAVLLITAALALLRALLAFLRHHRWCRAHREAYRRAVDFVSLVENAPELAVDDPWNYNEKGSPDPTPAWWDEIWEEKERSDALIEEYSLHSWRRVSGFLGLVPFLLVCALAAVMVLSEEVPALYGKTRSDIARIEAGQCETVTVWLSPKVREWHIDGPYSSGQPALLTRYGAVSDETGGQWVNLFVPYGLDFQLDEDRLYDENRSIQWNAEHAQMYEVTYTPDLFLIDSIAPAETPALYLS